MAEVGERVRADELTGLVPQGQERDAVLIGVESAHVPDEVALSAAGRRVDAGLEAHGGDVAVHHVRAEAAQLARVHVPVDVVAPEVERLLEALVAGSGLGAQHLTARVQAAVDVNGRVRVGCGCLGCRCRDWGGDPAARAGTVGAGDRVVATAGREGDRQDGGAHSCHETFHYTSSIVSEKQDFDQYNILRGKINILVSENK